MRRLILAVALSAACAPVEAQQRCTRVSSEGRRLCVPAHVAGWCVTEQNRKRRFECTLAASIAHEKELAQFVARYPDLPGEKVWSVAARRAGPEGLRPLRRCAKKLAKWIRDGAGKSQPRC